jgi:hypothetical protein
VISSPAWLWYGEGLQLLGILWIAVDVYRNGRRFGARRMRAIDLGIAIEGAAAAAWRRIGATAVDIRSRWLRFRHVPQSYQRSVQESATATDAVSSIVTYGEDTRVTLELRRRIEELEWKARTTHVVLDNHENGLTELRRNHRDLATGGVFVHAQSVVLVIVGSVIAVASSSLSSIGWGWSALILLSPAVLWFFVSPSGREQVA